MKRKGVSKGNFGGELFFWAIGEFKASPTTPPTDPAHLYLHSVHTHRDSVLCYFIWQPQKYTTGTAVLTKNVTGVFFCSHCPSMWYLVGILNRSDKSWKKALKSRLEAARPIDQFHAYKPALLSSSRRRTPPCDWFTTGADDLECRGSTEHVFPHKRCGFFSCETRVNKPLKCINTIFIFAVSVRLICANGDCTAIYRFSINDESTTETVTLQDTQSKVN